MFFSAYTDLYVNGFSVLYISTISTHYKYTLTRYLRAMELSNCSKKIIITMLVPLAGVVAMVIHAMDNIVTKTVQ